MADWFLGWIETHCRATGSGADVGDVLLANRRIITSEPWYADEGEMWDATNRLVSSGRTPKFANEHMDALYRELREIRAVRQAEAERSYSRQWNDPEARPKCDLCDGTTLVVAPHPRCIWQGRIVNHPVNGVFYSVSVLCDLCDVGREACQREDDRVNRSKEHELRKRPRQLTLGRYTSTIHGHDGVFLMRQHEKDQAEHVRRTQGGGAAEFAKMYPRLWAQIQERMARA